MLYISRVLPYAKIKAFTQELRMPKRTPKRSTGFGVIEIVIAIAVIALLGFIGWRVYETTKSKPTNNNTSTSSQTSNGSQANTGSSGGNSNHTDPNAGYVVIKEWGVRFKPVSGLAGAKYIVKSFTSHQPNYDSAWFSTSQITGLAPQCSVDKQPVAMLDRSKSPLPQNDAGYPLSIKQMNGYYYYYSTAPVSCDGSASTKLGSDASNAFAESFKSLEAAK